MTKFTRRRFLEDSLLAAAAMSAFPVSQVFAEEKKQSASPNEKLNLAIVGTGGRGGEHIRAFCSRQDIRLAYVVDTDEEVGQKRVAEIAKKYGYTPKFVKDMRKAFDDKSVDIVSTATPNHWHSLVSIWAMQAGKDVYVEKPISHNVSEGRRCVEAARKYNRICEAGTQCRSMGGSISAIEYIRAGKIGEVKLARGLCYKLRKSIGDRGTYQVPASVDYDLWSGPAPMAPLTRPKFHYDWHWQWLCGNGDLGNQGIHQMDVARWGLGVDTLSCRVFSYGGRLGYIDAGETANTQVIYHEFENGKTLAFEVRGLPTDKLTPAGAATKTTDPLMAAGVGVIFYGTNGYVVLTAYDKGVALDKNMNIVEKFTGNGDHFGNFIDAVRSRNYKDLRGDVLEGHLSSALCHTGNISYRLGQEVAASEVKKRLADIKTNDDTLKTFERVTEHLTANGVKVDETKMFCGPVLTFDPKTETFPGNEAANVQLTREYRKPYVVPAAGQV